MVKATDAVFHVIAKGISPATNNTVTLVDRAASIVASVSTRKGKIRKDLHRPDGLHLSGQGNDKLARIILRLIRSEICPDHSEMTIKCQKWTFLTL